MKSELSHLTNYAFAIINRPDQHLEKWNFEKTKER